MAALSDDQLNALRNLARKEAGEEVDWISISAARALIDLGLAERHPAGWRISSAGSAALMALGSRGGEVETLKPPTKIR